MEAILGSRLVDAERIIENPIVLIQDGVIKETGSRGKVRIPGGAAVHDASGCILMPGLVDCHVHFTGSDTATPGLQREPFETRLIRAAVVQTRQLLDAGITSVMDTGGLVGLHVRNAVRAGIVAGPRILAAGRYMSATGGHGDTHSLPLEWVKEGRPFGWGMDGRIADGVDECLKAVREQLRMSVDFIKICTSGGGGSLVDPAWVPEYSFEEIKAMVDEAHGWRRRVLVHCYYPEALRRSVSAGVDIVTHGNMADDDTVQLMRDKGTLLVPTMSVYERIHKLRPEAPVAEMYETLYGNIGRLHEAGLTLAVGTDTMGGIFPFGGSAFELELYVDKVGLKPREALTIGTLNGAKVMGLEDLLGTLREGKYADIIAVDGDPLDDMRVLQDKDRVKLVVAGGMTRKSLL
jgi:imidazolonepropionase-like amidohydrolase